ncbi:MAG TPA: TPM domain-containing protein [Verrucomicrobiales bacterium]|nr:TPM domain-containing protein [Verrucomicrobiales bacterium]
MASSTASSQAPGPAPITCPGCHVLLRAPVDQCPHCGYNAWTCVDRFPYSPPPLDRYIDVENRLSNEDRARIDRSIDALESDLPQVRIYVCIVKLLPGTDARECGFWMLNASVPRDEEETGHRPWSTLLLLDTQASAASATVGYGLDHYVADDELRQALASSQAEFERGDFGAGVLKFVHHLHKVLKQAHRRAVARVRQKGRQESKPALRPASAGAPASKARHPES